MQQALVISLPDMASCLRALAGVTDEVTVLESERGYRSAPSLQRTSVSQAVWERLALFTEMPLDIIPTT